jgi:hypothetical protein
MGDYGFPGAGEFGGRDENFNCLPDYHFSKCSLRYKFNESKFRKDTYCRTAYSGIEEDQTHIPAICDFCGDNYHDCPKFIKSKLGQKSE